MFRTRRCPASKTSRPASRTIKPLVSLVVLASLGGLASAGDIPLSSLLGVAPGSSTDADNPPFTHVVSSPYGLGVDCPGSFSSIPIQFGDDGVQLNGIGQHPPQSGSSSVEFDLDSIRLFAGVDLQSFSAIAGIERFSQPGAGANGATFEVYVDGVLAASATVADGYSPSVPFDVSIAGAHTLTLNTTHVGSFNGNHACWGSAMILLTEGCNPDLNEDGVADQGDIDYLINVIAGGSNPTGVNPDFNVDGVADQGDIDALINVTAGGQCP